jgi:D-alanyl-D-alanine carboxypeptidase
MSSARNEARCGLRGGAFLLAITVAGLAASSNEADARRHRHGDESAGPPSSSIVVDGNSGGVLQSANADELRHPASLTKIMTLYLLFEQLEAGRLKLDSPLRVSEHAADQSPTKLGLKIDSTIKVEDAIKGMVTRSANDAAVVVAENLGGSEEQFARIMTRKAQGLGMTKTVYRNASGLPNDEQVTTARDQSILGRAIQEHFPQYYPYFQTRSFSFHGQSIGNHNQLLGRVDGVDGIKTGYTQASGYNLVTSVHRNGHYLVAVVLGGASAGIRDARMRDLIEAHINKGSLKRSAPAVAETPTKSTGTQTAQTSSKPAGQTTAKPAGKDPERFSLASASAKSVPATADHPAAAASPATAATKPGSSEPIRPVIVKTLNIKPSNAVETASANPLQFTPAPKTSNAPIAAALPVEPAKIESAAPVIAAAERTELALAHEQTPKPTPKPTRNGWMIQVGAYQDEAEAKQKLSIVKSKASHLLASADPFTEAVQKDGSTYYRARFAGFDKEQAEAACKYLKRSDIECLTIRN